MDAKQTSRTMGAGGDLPADPRKAARQASTERALEDFFRGRHARELRDYRNQRDAGGCRPGVIQDDPIAY